MMKKYFEAEDWRTLKLLKSFSEFVTGLDPPSIHRVEP